MIAPTGPIPVPGLAKLAPYVQGQSAIPGVAGPIKLSANESPHGPSPAALDAYRRAAGQLHRYPDGAQTELRRAIGETFGLNPDGIICGNGSDELILLLMRAYLRPREEVLLSENSFEMCPIHCFAQGGQPVFAPERGYRVDVEALLARATPRTKLCVIANPNNPTGTCISAEELQRLRTGLPEGCLLVIDGAYAEYVDRADFGNGFALAEAGGNTAVTRTFSKIHGLAGLRIGWAFCPPLVADAVQRIRTPFNANGPAMAAAAAAVRDQAHVRRVRRHNAKWLERIHAAVTEMGLEMIPSVANFYLLRFPEGGGKSGTEAAAFLMGRGIIPRPAAASDQFLRITVGLDGENEAVLQALADYLAS